VPKTRNQFIRNQEVHDRLPIALLMEYDKAVEELNGHPYSGAQRKNEERIWQWF
jgi:hypothetical protein